MSASNFSEADLAGNNAEYAQAVQFLYNKYGFDFVAIGLTAFVGAPLRWIYSAGATGERYKRIVLAPGHGIGGTVIKAGKPMVFTDIDKDIDPREYSSYPIVFAEDLRSFCALPLLKKHKVVGSLLCAFRSVDESHAITYQSLIEDLQDKLADMDIVSEGFLNLANILEDEERGYQAEPLMFHTDLSRVISAQENERKRISRELHDGIIQELVTVSFSLKQLEPYLTNNQARSILVDADNNISRILDELHNISVELRPSALDHLGLLPALRSQASVFEKAYGAEIVFEGILPKARFDSALETQIYRICQEAILNSCKYSGTEKILVDLEESDGWLHASITDYGIGFDTEKPTIKGSGVGLVGMYERAHLIGASLDIESSDGGTKVTLVAPLGLYEREAQ